jgi:AraC family transcriptional regulator
MPADTEVISNVTRYIADHINEPLPRVVLASVAGFSVPHLQRIFKARLGESIAAYVRRVRLRRAGQKLLMGAVDITEVALAAGYDTHAAFGKAFKQRFGLSPGELRRLNSFTAMQILRKGNRYEDQTYQCIDR